MTPRGGIPDPASPDRTIEVRSALGRFDDFATVVGTKRPDAGGCWCMSYRRLMRSRTIPFVDERDAWSVVCFVVRPGFRRQGLMHHLLAGAVEHAARHGAEVVEGYPAETGGTRIDTISGYVGTVELFEAGGFFRAAATSAHAGHRDRWLMRRELAT